MLNSGDLWCRRVGKSTICTAFAHNVSGLFDLNRNNQIFLKKIMIFNNPAMYIVLESILKKASTGVGRQDFGGHQDLGACHATVSG